VGALFQTPDRESECKCSAHGFPPPAEPQTAPAGQSVTSGGGVILYDDKPDLDRKLLSGLRSGFTPTRTPALWLSNRSNVTLTTGGLSSPASASTLAAKSSTAPK
jgi:hypothetical protein